MSLVEILGIYVARTTKALHLQVHSCDLPQPTESTWVRDCGEAVPYACAGSVSYLAYDHPFLRHPPLVSRLVDCHLQTKTLGKASQCGSGRDLCEVLGGPSLIRQLASAGLDWR